MLCDSAASGTAEASGHHHGSGHNVEAPVRPSTDVQIGAVSGHDCSTHDSALPQASATVAERVDRGIVSIHLATNTVTSTFNALTEPGSRVDYRTPLSTAPPTAIPLVLRV
jgi:hypothetical protein